MFDMGSAGAFSMMKTEAKSIATSGPAYVLSDYPNNIKPLLHSYLSASVATDHKDPVGDAHVEGNQAILDDEPTKVKELESATGTVPLSFTQEWCMNVYCKLLDALKKGDDDNDQMPKFYLDFAGATAQPESLSKSKNGGFRETYEHVNVTATDLNKCDQDRCIFRCPKVTFVKIVGGYGNNIIAEANGFIKEYYGAVYALKYIDVLFNWNKHSFFTYHQDMDGDLSVIINLTHGKAWMHVA